MTGYGATASKGKCMHRAEQCCLSIGIKFSTAAAIFSAEELCMTELECQRNKNKKGGRCET